MLLLLASDLAVAGLKTTLYGRYALDRLRGTAPSSHVVQDGARLIDAMRWLALDEHDDASAPEGRGAVRGAVRAGVWTCLVFAAAGAVYRGRDLQRTIDKLEVVGKDLDAILREPSLDLQLERMRNLLQRIQAPTTTAAAPLAN